MSERDPEFESIITPQEWEDSETEKETILASYPLVTYASADWRFHALMMELSAMQPVDILNCLRVLTSQDSEIRC